MATTEVADGRDYNQLVQDNVALLEKSNSVVVLLNAIEQALPKIQVMSFNQSNFISSLISLLSSTSSSVANPGSNASFNYKTVTRILIAYLAKIDLSKELFNLIQSLIAILNLVPSGLDKERMIANKVGACWAVGEIWSHYGNGVMSLFVEVILTSTKLFKTTSLPIPLRCAALSSIRKVMSTSGKSMSDQLLKDTIKILRGSGISDRNSLVVKESCDCLLAIITTCHPFTTISEMNDIITPSLKALESTEQQSTRRSLCRLVSTLLSSTQVEGSALPVVQVKKKKGDGNDEEENDSYPTIGVPTASDGVAKTLLSPTEMLSMLSTIYNKPTTSKRLHNGIIQIYSALFILLGSTYVEQYYSDIARHLIEEIGSGSAAGSGYSGWNAKLAERTEPNKARYDSLMARKVVGILLRDVISSRLLTEPGQIAAAQELATMYLKKWPSLLPSQAPPSKQSLIISLEEVSGLLKSLGCAPSSLQDVLYDSLIRLVAHPSHSIQVTASWTLRSFCDVAPTRLSSTINHMVELLSKELSLLSSSSASPPSSSTSAAVASPPDAIPRRAIGHAHALAALIAIIPRQPLYISFDLSAKCMSLAIQLLKQSGTHELRISGIEIQVVWIIVGSLMSLGPHFVRLHLPQLLILWRNALPKVTNKETSAALVRGENEWAWLLHIRECTLGSILSFLKYNSGSSPLSTSPSSTVTLINEDVGRRIVALLSNALTFSNSFATIHASTLANQTLSTTSNLQLVDRDLLFRKRIIECFVALGQNNSTRSLQVPLLQQIVVIFSDSEHYLGGPVGGGGEGNAANTIAASGGNFTNVWDEGDNRGWGVNTLISVREGVVDNAGGSGSDEGDEEENGTERGGDEVEEKIADLLRRSILEVSEHDSSILSSASTNGIPTRPPVASGLINSAIELFSLYFPLQESPNQSALIQSLLNNYNSNRIDKNPGRRMAILANALVAVLGSLRIMMRPSSSKFNKPAAISPIVSSLLLSLIYPALSSSSSLLRSLASEVLGRVSSLSPTSFMASQITHLVSLVVSNTSPSSRSGCALSFSSIYHYVGALSGTPILKTTIEILFSLSEDNHPQVHYYALKSLSRIIGTASLSYVNYVKESVDLMMRLVERDSHDSEEVRSEIGKVVRELIGVLGPELRETSSEKTREKILILLNELGNVVGEERVITEVIGSLNQVRMFTQEGVIDVKELIKRLIDILENKSRNSKRLKMVAVNCIYSLIQTDSTTISKLGGDRLVNELFRLLDEEGEIEGVKEAITSWLRRTGEENGEGWIRICERIMSSSSSSSTSAVVATASANDMIDEESQGLGIDNNSRIKTSRWRTQLFALQCLHEIFETIKSTDELKRAEHFGLSSSSTNRRSSRRKGVLVGRVGDLIKMAFTASTASVMEIRLEGLVVLRDVIENFSQTYEISFDETLEGILLLDQYQAPIAAALTPAFAVDSYPEVLASAIQVCAIFVGSGVVREIEKMGRILRLLTNALESCRESDMTSLGEVKDLSSTASVMLKTSIFAAWAQFQIASIQQPYLVKVIEPQLELLCPLWISSLREYARVRTDPEATSSDSGVGGATFDSVYSGLSRETALPFYERSWPQTLHAVATLLKSSNPHMIRAIDGIDSSATAPIVSIQRESPTLFFWVLFGLSFEALCSTPPPAGNTSPVLVQAIALQAIAGLIRPEISGTLIWSQKGGDALVEELGNLCYRLAITEGSEVRSWVMQIVTELAKGLISTDTSQALEKDEKMLVCLKVATCVLKESIPSSSSTSSASRSQASSVSAHISLLKTAFVSFANLADLFITATSASMRDELFAIALFYYSELLKDETSTVDLVEPTLPILKLLITRAFNPPAAALKNPRDVQMLAKAVNAMLADCLKNAGDVRGRKGISVGLKLKNNLLASVLLLTTLPSVSSEVKVSQAVVEHACFLITRSSLSSDLEISTPALHCLTSLLIASSRSNGVLQFCVGQLLPGVIEYIAQAAELDYLSGDVRLIGLSDVVKALVLVLSNVQETMLVQSLSLLLPILILLLSTASSPSHLIGLSHLISIASKHSIAFKQVTTKLSDSQRKLLETSIRAAMSSEVTTEKKEDAPRIELKKF